tara:strand:+ start:53 stop:544 length:492 start_codon:yes stop_codon:yes gene_type:complete
MYQFPGNDYQPQHPHLFEYSASTKRQRDEKKLLKRITILCNYKDVFSSSNKPSQCTGKIAYSKDVDPAYHKENDPRGKDPNDEYKPEYDWFFIRLWIIKMPQKELDLFLENGTFEPFKFKRRKYQKEWLMFNASEKKKNRKNKKYKTMRVIYLTVKSKKKKGV